MTSLLPSGYHFHRDFAVEGAVRDDKMTKRKSCPKCKTGNIGVDRDQYGWYEYCIQCGYTRDLINVTEIESAAEVNDVGKKAGVLGEGEKASD